jgi:hypothetical protein
MKRRYALLVCLLTTLAIGCNKTKDTTPANAAHVMFVNGCTATGNIYVADSLKTLSGPYPVAFDTTVGYQSLAAGTEAMLVYISSFGNSRPLQSATTTFYANDYYSVFVGGTITKPSFFVTTDDLSAPAQGMAKIRFVNLSSDTLSETVTVGSNLLAVDVAPATCTPFSSVIAGKYAITSNDPDKANSTDSLKSRMYVADSIYTIVLTGSRGTDSFDYPLHLSFFLNDPNK